MDREHDEPEQDQVAAVTAALRGLDTPAPASLRSMVEAAVAEAEAGAGAARSPGAGGRAGRRWAGGGLLRGLRPRTLVAATGAIAVALAVVLALVLPGGDATPVVADVAPVALRDATTPAPAPVSGGRLDATVDDVWFPNWSRLALRPGGRGWRATGARSDRVGGRAGGRAVRTVFYANDRGERVGYAIAAGDALPAGEGRYAVRNGVPMWVYDVGGATAVMWHRDGHTCVVAGRDVDEDTLLALASARSA